MPTVSCPLHHSPLQRTWLYLLDDLLEGAGRMLSGPLETASSPGLRSPDPSAFLHRASVPAPNHLGGSPLNSLQLVDAFLVLESPRLEVVF